MRWLLLGARIFAMTGVPFGVIQGLVYRSTATGVVDGVLFGLIMGVTLTAITAARTRQGQGSLSTKHRAEVVIELSLPQVHDRIAHALAEIPAKITHDSQTRVVARTRMSWQSWGEVVSAELVPTEAGTVVELASRAWLRGTVADYGRNRDNVDRLETALHVAQPGRA